MLERVFAHQLPLLRGRKELPCQAGPSSDGRLGKLLLNQEGPECNGVLFGHISQWLLVPKEIEQIANRMAPMHHCLWLDVRATGAVVVQKLAQADGNAGLYKTGVRQLAVQFIAYAVHPLDDIVIERAAHANAVQQVLKFDPDGVAQPL